MDNHILPARLYKFIPVIYIGLGVYIWFKLDTVYALISAVMMVGAGMLALLMRQRTTDDTHGPYMKQQEPHRPDVSKQREED